MSILALLFAVVPCVSQPDRVLADFEGPTYGDWVAAGEAFGAGPAQGTLPNQWPVSGFEGHGLVNSFHGGDRPTGRLTSPEFVIDRKAITFLIGGGGWEGKTCMNLLVDGKVVRTAAGPNVRDGGTEALERVNWDVAELAGKKAKIEIVDDASGGWGHVNVDQIVLTDSPLPGRVKDASRTIRIEKPYLNFPVRHDQRASLRHVSIVVDGKVAKEFDTAITELPPDYYVFVDSTPWIGKDVTVRVDQLAAGGAALDKLVQGDGIALAPGEAPVYQEKLRPLFHFTSRRGWINDPNGMVYADGQYHMYYQHSPYTWFDNPKHWGHAVSRDMVHWKELPTAISPRTWANGGDWVWSGSAVVDERNTSGWRKGDEKVIVAAYTSTGRGECIVYSSDGGKTFTEFEGNPVVKHAKGEGRDPRLLWHATTKHWVMAVYDEDTTLPEPQRRGVVFYTSSDLKAWSFASRVGGFYECPDMFELPVDAGGGGGGKATKWVLTAADSWYMLGQFDGKVFTPDEVSGAGGGIGKKYPGNSGDRFYAAQTFSQTPDGRRVQIGWGRFDMPGMPFNQMMSFPCELKLRQVRYKARMFAWPVKEIESLYGRSWKAEPMSVSSGKPAKLATTGEGLDVTATLDVADAKAIELVVRGMPVRVEPSGPADPHGWREMRVTCAGRTGTFTITGGRLSLRVLADRPSLEVFANQGEVSMLVAGAFTGDGVELTADGGTAKLEELVVHEVRSAW